MPISVNDTENDIKRLFLLKFAKPGVRQSFVIESGFRCHLTDYTRATAAAPSVFVTRLRKFLRTRRVTSVSQVGTDRIIEIGFSDGQYRLFLEFYAGGNVVLTDKELVVISLLRTVNEESEQLKVGAKYLLENRQNYHGVPAITQERVKRSLERAVETSGELVQTSSKRAKKPENALRKALAFSLNELPPLVIDYALQVAHFDPKTPTQEVLRDSSLMDKLINALKGGQNLVKQITKHEICRGYIIAKPAKSALVAVQNDGDSSQQPLREALMYEDFQPFRPQQLEDKPAMTVIEIDGYNKTVDEFFSSIESQKISSRLTEREENAMRKLQTARLDHEKRLGGLHQTQELNVRRAQAIEANLPRVQEAIAAVNGLLAQGMDWMDVGRLVEMEQAKQNVVANLIKLPLKLYENSITLLLSEAIYCDDDYDGEQTGSDVSNSSGDEEGSATKSKQRPGSEDERLTVDIDLALSPWSNACRYYDQKKSAAVKEQKTLQSSEKALKNTEKKISADLKKGLKQEKEVMRPQRKAFWFEKFMYFISSEGYLIIGGKDAPQSEILYKRYLKKGDVYIHADLNGAASVIVKNKAKIANSPIPPSTLSQAGTLVIATSSAWDSKAGMSAWWVNADQVSKTAPTGEYLTAGTFTVRGQKNFLPPAQLLLGFGLFFKISEESKARHLKHRVQDEDQKAPSASEEGTKHEENADETAEDALKLTGSDEENEQNLSDHTDEEGLEMQRPDEAESGSEADNEDDRSNSEIEQNNPLQSTQSRLYKVYPQTKLESETSADRDSSDERKIESAGQDTGDEQAVTDRKRHLSAKERRALRKGPTSIIQELSVTATESPIAEGPTESPMHAGSAPADASGTKTQVIVRGRHGKINKLKSKYADQDEEDRALAMRLLGSTAAQKKANQEAASKTTREKELAEQKERRRKQHEMAATKGKELEEIRRRNFEEGIEITDDDGKEEMDDLDAFVGAPLPGDEILDILVTCGPWDAIGTRCRWRAKLQPGTTKKGKAVREILGKWLSTLGETEKKRRPGSGEGNEAMVEEEKVKSREAELIRGIRESEVIGVVPVGKVRVALGPGETARGKGGGGGGTGKGKRGGKGSKKQR